MQTVNFNEISERYEKDSLVQKNASETLMGLLQIGGSDEVLDIGCGTGSLTALIGSKTSGKVLGIDPSEGMIKEALAHFKTERVNFQRGSAEDMNFIDRFDVLFCNSAFQWFSNAAQALSNCYQALKKNGRMGIQAPATKSYCPNFVEAVNKIKTDARTETVFSRFKDPWLFLDTADEYNRLFEKTGFRVVFSRIEQKTSLHTPDEAFKVFESGAAAGYLNRDHYDTDVPDGFIEDFRKILKETLNRQVKKDNRLELVFNRIYLIAVKD